MTLLIDLAVLAVTALAAYRGWRLGVSGVVARLAGGVVGLVVGLWLASSLVSDRLSPVAHLGLGAAIVLGCCLVAGRIGSVLLGTLVRHAPAGGGARTADRAAGAVLRGAIAAGVCSVLLAVVAGLAPPAWSAATRDSAATSLLAPAGVALRTLGGDALRMAPADLAALIPAVGADPPSDEMADEVASRVRTGVVEVQSQDCGQGVQGTGFAVGDGLYVTNAHVVRGTSGVQLLTVDGARADATVVGFAPGSDLAILRADGLDAAPLTLGSDAANGTAAVVVGYPLGVRTTTPAAVLERLPLPGSQTLALHQAYVIDSPVRHGNSGSPLLDLQGRVIGVVNALSTTDTDDGFATTVTELRRVLSQSAGRSTPVPTGTCTTEKGTS